MTRHHALWKLVVDVVSDPLPLDVPVGAEVVGCGVQGMDVVIWIRCDPEGAREPRHFVAVPTGAFVDTDWLHHGVAQRPDGIVVHVMEPPRR